MEYAWIVSRDEEVEAVLASGALHTRPAERVPKAMQGTRLGSIFERLVRMNDGDRHDALRRRVEERLAQWDLGKIARIAHEAASRLAPKDIAGYTVATVIGLREPQRALPWIRDFADAIAGGAGDEAISRGIAATQPLLDALPDAGDDDEIANTLGFLFQTYAATARLIDNVMSGRTDAPVVMTRRYAADDIEICGKSVRKGDAIVVLLTSPRFHFGAGRHACPGRRIAEVIANAAAAIIAQDRSRISV